MDQLQPINEQKLQYLKDHQKNMNLESKPLEIYNLEIKESKIPNSGLGLFTKCNIPKHSIICYYPCDIINVPEEEKYYENGEEVNINNIPEDKTKKIYNGDYNLNLPPYIIVAWEGERNNKMYVGNFMNDKGYKPNKIYKSSLNNCGIQGLDVISLRDIKAGEELCYSYGKSYWYDRKEGIDYSRNQLIKDKL